MNIEEAIKTAIEYETKVREVYAEALKSASDPKGNQVFQVLADEEKHHLEYLEHKLKEWKETGKVTAQGLETSIPSKGAIAEGVRKLERHMSQQDRGSEITMLQKALEAEEEASSFYKKMVAELPAEGQDLFARFVEIEEGHTAIVQAELDYLGNTGFWFDFQEFTMEG